MDRSVLIDWGAAVYLDLNLAESDTVDFDAADDILSTCTPRTEDLVLARVGSSIPAGGLLALACY